MTLHQFGWALIALGVTGLCICALAGLRERFDRVVGEAEATEHTHSTTSIMERDHG